MEDKQWVRARSPQSLPVGAIVRFFEGDVAHKILSFEDNAVVRVENMANKNIQRFLATKIWEVRV